MSKNNINFSAGKRLVGYAMKYKWRFIYAVLAGVLVGFSIFAMLSSIENLFDPSTAGATAVEAQAAEPDYMEKALNYLGYEKLNEDGSITFAFMLLSIFTFPFFMAMRGLFTYFNRFAMRWVGTHTIADIRNDLFKNLTSQSLRFYSKNEVGKMISRIGNDTAMAERFIASSLADLTRAPMEIIACLSFIIYHAIKLEIYSVAIAFAIGAPLCIIPIIMIGQKIKKITKKPLQKISGLTSHMLETFTGIKVVKAYHMEENESNKFVATNRQYVKNVIRGVRYELMIAPVIEIVGIMLVCVFMVYAYMKGLEFKHIAPFGIAAGLAHQPLKRIGKIIAALQRSLTGAERSFAFIDLIPDLVETEGAAELKGFDDKFEFKNVSFKYEPEGSLVVDGLNLEIKKGEMVAFVGETGSGKTTISNLLARFYDPTSGSITIDGTDLRDVKIESLRELIGVVTQDTIIFNDSIAYNIGYGSKDVSEEDIIEAAKKANAHEFIMEKEQGYNTSCGEKGFVLSGGQKQRISIARAIMKNPPILILDEATSALDTVTEQLVQDALNNLMGNRTVFAIAHRLSTIKHADKICVLDQGKVVEFGSHDELYAQNGKYRKLCDMQFS